LQLLKQVIALRKYFYLVLVACAWLIVITGETGCANIVPPTGGPRDTLPPLLISATPRDSTLRFSGNRVTFTFNEYVDVQSASENLIVSPTPKIQPAVEFRLRTVTVRLKDTLEANTTYSLNFGDAIRDINENNILKNFTYVFSTGTYLDNRQFSGSVILAETGKVDSTLTVMLHLSGDDSAVVKERPRYYTRLNGQGKFTFRNLPAGRFFLYALKDESNTRRYDSRAQLFAFASEPIQITDSVASQTLYAYAEPEERPRTGTRATAGRNAADKRLTFSTNLESNRQDLLDSLELKFPTPLKKFDSSGIVLTDINFKVFPGVNFAPDSLFQKYSIAFNWIPDSTYNLILAKGFAEDSLGKSLLKADTITFKAKKTTDYGNVRLRFPDLDLSRHPVLQFTQNDAVKQSAALTAKEFRQQLFKPGDYYLRILYDDNQNGIWDPGSFFGVKRQPEIVQAFEKKVTVKANWDNDEVFRQ
jgi:hypothetical protein